METPSSTIQVDFPDRPRSGPGAWLVQVYPTGPGIGRRHAVRATPLLIGRDVDCDIILDDAAVAGRQVRVQPTIDGCYAVDLNSGGTFVNEETVTKRKLRDGDCLRVGAARFRFLEGRNVEAAYHEEIYRLTILDPLTGAHNRRSLMERLAIELARCARYGRSLALLLLDIDGLKGLNEGLGTPAGDAVLQEVAGLIQARIRRSDLVARYGGDEFAMLLTETGPDGAAAVAEDLRRRIESHLFRFQGQSRRLTVSLGVALATDSEPATPKELLRQADARLYEAKRAGGNRTAG
jgi:diguanylate cyclase (GGDEF)-like protein